MGLKLIDVIHDQTKGLVIFESDLKPFSLAISELQNKSTRDQAIQVVAGEGLPDPRINGSVTVYPVDSEGNQIDRPKEQTTVAYRGEVPLTRRLV